MSAIKAFWKNGQIVPVEPIPWPEGSPLRIEQDCENDDYSNDDLHGDTPESIARWIAEVKALPHWDMTPEEEAAWQEARREQRELEFKRSDSRAEKLRSMFE
jgi:hypothetical protein